MNRRSLLKTLAAGLPAAFMKGTNALDPFSLDRIHEIRIDLPPGEWKRLRDNYLTNDWYKGQFTFDGVTAKADFRSRGNGSRDGEKPGLKVSFKRPGTEPFLNLETLVLGNLKQDGSCLKDGLSYELFRRMDIPAPRLSYARVTVDGEYWGLYTVVEDLDSAFLKNTYGRTDGFLYEYNWQDEWNFGPREGGEAGYLPAPFEPKTNTKSNEHKALFGVIERVSQAPDADFSAAMGAGWDLKQFIRFIATETFNDDRDSILGDWGMNNFYLHRAAGSTQFSLIAWDKNWSFFDWKQPLLLNGSKNLLLKRMLQRTAWRDELRRELARAAEIAGGPGGWLENEIRSRAALIYNTAIADPKRITGMGRMEEGVPHLLEFAQRRTDFVRQSLGQF